jgi:hypothetical protein
MNNDKFSYNADLHRLEFNGKALSEGELIEICVFGHWLPGHLAIDSSGWHLITLDQIVIDLREGILARRPHGHLLVDSASNGHAIQQ